MSRSPAPAMALRARSSRTRAVRALAAAVPTLLLAGTSHAWLGGFEAGDGYLPFLNMTQNYNAGQFGPNGGYGGGSAVITPGTGLWSAINGGFFSPGGAVSYATGHQNFDRLHVNSGGAFGLPSDQALVFTTGHEGWGGPALKYKYLLDAPDLGGTAPAATGSSVIKLSFWVRGQLYGTNIGGQVPNGYIGNEITFEDTAGNVGVRLALTERASGDTVTYWDGTSMVESAIVGATGVYDQWSLTLDLANDTFSASYFQFATSTNYAFVTNQPMQNAMSAFTAMTFRSSDGINNAKLNSVDDFSFHVDRIPTPGAAGLFASAALFASRRRRR